MGPGFGFVLSLNIYTNNRIDNLENKIDANRNELAKKIGANHKQIISILLKRK